MKYLFSILMVLFLAFPAMAQEEETQGNVYTIDLGDGQGAILIFGDNNTVYLPDVSETEITPNEITVSNGRINLVLTDTDLIVGGIKTRYSKLVFILEPDGWELIWYEQ